MDLTTIQKGHTVYNIVGDGLKRVVEQSGVLQFAVVYHDNCMDGAFAMTLMATMLESNFRPESTKLIPMSYGKALEENIVGQHVILVDFSFSIPELAEFCKTAASVTVIDHHITATDPISKWQDKPANFYYYLSVDPKNETDSGASLVYNFWHPTDEGGFALADKKHVEKLVELLRVHDLWLHDGDVNSPALHLNYWFNGPPSSLKSFALVETLTPLFWNIPMLDNCIQYGKQLVGNAVKYLRKQIADHAREIVVDGKLVQVIECEKRFNSMMGTLLNEDPKYAFAVTYLIRDDNKFEYSLRSTREKDYNVGELAKQLGGGGHRRAAGFVSVIRPEEVFKMLDMADFDPMLPPEHVKITVQYVFRQLNTLLDTFDFTVVRERTTKFSAKTPLFDIDIKRQTCLQNEHELQYFAGELRDFIDRLERSEVNAVDNANMINNMIDTTKKIGFPTVVGLDIKLGRTLNSVRVSFRDHAQERRISGLVFPRQSRS